MFFYFFVWSTSFDALCRHSLVLFDVFFSSNFVFSLGDPSDSLSLIADILRPFGQISKFLSRPPNFVLNFLMIDDFESLNKKCPTIV